MSADTAAGKKAGLADLTRDEQHAGLRRWARGMYPYEAAVELLIRSGLADRGDVQHKYMGTFQSGGVWIDPDELARDVTWAGRVGEGLGLSGGERRMLSIAGSLLHSGSPTSLIDALCGLDDDNIQLVIQAVRHCHDGTGFPR